MKIKGKKNLSNADYILVDAHNLCYQMNATKEIIREDPEAAREMLERRIGHNRRIILFYDGGEKGEFRRTSRNGLLIFYSGSGEADNVIVDFLQQQKNKTCVIVTDDRQLTARAEAYKAKHCAVSTFIEYISRNKRPEHDRMPIQSKSEVDTWIEIFEE